jgi:uncharacterized protein YidB (DUF937 family)
LEQDEIDHLAAEAGVQPDESQTRCLASCPAAIDRATPQGVIPSVEKAGTGAFDR